MRTARITLAVLLGLLTILAFYVALTVPMIASTGPIIFALACAAVTWFVFPRRHRVK